MPRLTKWPNVLAFAFVAVIATSGAANATYYGHGPNPGEVIITWNSETLDAVRVERMGAAGAGRLYAMVNAAMYDAVNGIDRARFGRFFGRESALIDPYGAPRRGNRQAAAAAAAHAVLVAEVPDLALDFDAQLAADLARLGGGSRVAAGQQWGANVGDAVVQLRATDGSSPQEIQAGGTGPGQFRADFTSAQYRNMTPFAIDDATPYISAGAPDLTSVEYAGALAEVQIFGDRRNAQPMFDQIFNFWRGGGGTGRPPGEWIKITMVVAEQEDTTDSLSATARLFALQGMAMGDSVIPAWASKFESRFWRPATAIKNASTDGNPLTVEDQNWIQRNGSIGGSPEHTSGQSTFAGAGSTILAGFYCTDDIEFTFTGDNAIAGPRSFETFSDAAREAGRARIMAGIHFEFSNQAGQKAGRGVGSEILTESLQRLRPLHGPGPKCPQA